VDSWGEALGHERREVSEQFVAERSMGDFRWIVMADPAGNEFCVSGG
jgi:hypothetical protein